MNCPSCHTESSANAKFCFNCGEQLIKSIHQEYTLEIPDEIRKIKSWGYRLVRVMPMPYWVSLILVWQLILCGDYIIANYLGADSLLLFNFFLYGSFASASITIEFCNREMQRFYPRLATFVSEPQEKIKTWYLKGLHSGYMSIGSLICGLLFGIIGAISIYEIAEIKSGPYPELILYRVIASGIGLFFMGTGTWGIFCIIRVANQLSQFRINVKLFAVGNDSVMALGTLFLRMSLAIAGVYVMVVIADVLAGILTSYIILFWNAIGVICIFLFFVIPQYRIHKLMLKEKQQRLKSFTVYLEKTMNESLHEPSAEKLHYLKSLFELREHLTGMHEWTFSSGAISQLISVLLIPLLLVLLEVYMSK
ncbi:MAG: hypothetical protein K2X86_01745 [Cytophagaceae bacterium]|nr:hypothetical protein [Cytophagaceae bacterium]